MNTKEHHYKLLGVTPESSLQEINQAYVHALAQLHPDRLSDEPRRQKRAQEQGREINEAYSAIKRLHLSPGTRPSSPEVTSEAAVQPQVTPRAPALENTAGKRRRPGRLILVSLLLVPLLVIAVRHILLVPAPPRTTPPAPPPAPAGAPLVAPPPLPVGPAEKTSPLGDNSVSPSSGRPSARVPAARKSVAAATRPIQPAPQQETAGQSNDPAAAQAARVRETADHGDAAAQARLGSLYAAGDGVRQDYGEALTWYRKAAERENVAAQVWLGYLYAMGKGTRQDLAEAAKWYRRAADRKNVTAQVWLGYLYATGKGVPQDFGESATWYRRAAEQGSATAQAWLGYLYETGKGVPQDFGEALMWYYKAAQQGDATAQKQLTRMSRGVGRPRSS